MNSILALVFVLFLGLKLGEVGVVADWSWWAVFSPLLVAAALWVFVVIVALFADD